MTASAGTIIGTRHTRGDAEAKATGAALYTADVPASNAFEAAVARSPHPFARIVSIDITRASGMPGVAAIVYSGNAPQKPFDFSIKDQHLFPQRYVRYAGEPIAAVAAETFEQARAAAAAIEVQYEPLTPVMTIDEALAPNARLVHPDWQTYEHGRRVLNGNICGFNRIRRGNVDEALSKAHVVVESRFVISPGIPGYIEPKAAVVHRDTDGRVTVWGGTQSPYSHREELANFFDLPVENVRFINQFVGGAFGGKLIMAPEWYAMALALRCDRPVRMVWSRHEDGLNVFPRHGGTATFRSGADADGRLLAMHASFKFDTGAYLGYGSGTGLIATMLASGPYRVHNIDLDATLVYTNKQVAGPVRAPGGPQATFAKELHIDEIARALRMDPLEFRLRNVWRDGDLSPTGQKLESVSAEEALRQAAAAIGWDAKRAKNSGVGIGLSWWFSSCGRSEARVEVREDGSVHVISGNPEIGTGSAAGALPIIVADHFGIDPSQVHLSASDTQTATYDEGTHGSGATFSAGWAVDAAAQDARRQLIEAAEDKLEARAEDIELRGGVAMVRGAPDHAVKLADLAKGAGGNIVGKGAITEMSDPEVDESLTESHDFPAWRAPSFTCSAAQVEVEPETGRVNVKKIVTAQDVGFAINPTGIIGQMEGGAVQALGFALTEELQFDERGIVNPGLGDYLLPTALDAPQIESIVLQSPSREGLRGMKGAGEAPVTTPSAAIGNAIRDAVDIVPYVTPMTPERVWRALKTNSNLT